MQKKVGKTGKRRRGNPENLVVRKGKEAQELGRKGGIASGVARRARCSFADVLRQALTVPIPMTSDRQGAWTRLLERFGMCDMTAQNLIMCRVLQSAIEGDIKAAAFIRDTLMMTSGGIEGGEDAPFVFPFTPSGQERMAQYQFYELEARHDIMRPLLDEALELDRASCLSNQTDRLREIMVQSAKAAHREGRLTIDEETGMVTLRLVQEDDDTEAESAGAQ